MLLKRGLFTFLANLIFIVHLAIILFIAFGWLFASLHWLYLGLVLATALLDAFLGFCILSKWEFYLRQKANPSIFYPHSYLVYYVDKIFKGRISDRFINIAFNLFLWGSLAVNLIFTAAIYYLSLH